ncbi:hypothetical protein [Blastomonas sp. CCH1-A6]|jgi:hypothetical protein|uniref:hypothetical protein n=1 Tax=Blastomonas sp. CCH1-A6 TaxID=1768762 RepID=UPI000B212229
MKLQLLAILAFAVPTTATAPEKFDLKCTGERQFHLESPVEPHSYGFRIDLKSQKWCWEHCDIIFDIAQVHPDRLILAEKHEVLGRVTSHLVNVIDRTNGNHRFRSSVTGSTGNVHTINGTCEPAPFSGFPATKF